MKEILLFIGKLSLVVIIAIVIIVIQNRLGYNGYFGGYFCGVVIAVTSRLLSDIK
jgi:hypothetical protein